MQYEDFASIVQLGVGLHIGTALFQLFGEIQISPLARCLSRAKRMIDDNTQIEEGLIEEYQVLESKLEIWQIQFFNEYRSYFYINTAVAFVLLVALICITFMSNDEIPLGWAIALAALSTLPALTTVACLWVDAAKHVKPIEQEAKNLEKKLRGSTR